VKSTSHPLVSVLLPVHNAAATLESCLRSIARQSESDWECVAVDDGSSDESAARLDAQAAADPRFRVLHRPHLGLVAALQSGLGLCRGRYVARMDADDLMHRHRLRDQQRWLVEQKLDAVGCRVRTFPRATLRAGNRAYERWLNAIEQPDSIAREMWIECPVAHPTLMIRRDCLERFGYADRGWPEDYDLILRLAIDGRRVGVLPQRRLSWRNEPSRLSRNHANYGLDRFTRCKAYYLARSFLADSGQYVLWGYGQTGRALRRELARLDKHPSHIVEVHRGRLGNRIHDAPVIPPHRLVETAGRPLLVSVSGLDPRTEIRSMLAGMGYREGREFLCCA